MQVTELAGLLRPALKSAGAKPVNLPVCIGVLSPDVVLDAMQEFGITVHLTPQRGYHLVLSPCPVISKHKLHALAGYLTERTFHDDQNSRR